MTTSSRYHVFLSHHAADQPAVEAIARLLRAADLTPFLDRWHLVPGDPWMEAIEEALATSETVAVFVGPSGIGPWQNEEMRVALYDSAVRGKRVIPVLLTGADPQRVSPFLTRRTWVDFRAGPDDDDALQRLIAGIQGRPSEAGGYLSPLDLAPPQRYFTPFQAPPLPPYFVPRPEATETIRAALLDARSDTPGVLAISAIHGLGGIGKTTLIAALAHDPAIRQRYPDGILWATLGQQPELFPRLLEWIQQLGDYTFKPTTLEGASSHLRTLLIDKACLLVVDDGWQREHVDHFLVGGPRSQVVITTRDATLARKLRAHLHDLDVMTEAQALALFEGRLGTLSAANERDQAAALARELGYLPLALELAAAQIESDRSWNELLTHFRSAFADLAILDLDEPTRRDESLRICFALSLDSLTEEDRNAFVWFGALPEDAIIGPAMAATLWDETEDHARERLRRLRQKALLKATATGQDRYTVHDLLHDESTLRLAQQMPLADAHAALLARYRSKATQNQWHTLPDDGYIHGHLTWHIEQTGQIDAIHALLREETTDGWNGWYQALERLGHTATYKDDISRASHYAATSEAVGLGFRYRLVTASLNSLAGNLRPELLAMLVHESMWSSQQALTYAHQIPNEELRSMALVALAPHLSEAQLTKALHTTSSIQSDRYRSEALVGLSSYLTGHQLTAALTLVQTIQEGDDRAQALVAVAPHLSEPQLASAMSAATGLEDEGLHSQALAALAPYLTKSQLTRALASVSAIYDEEWRADALVALAPYLSRDQLLEASAIARAMKMSEFRSRALAIVLFHLGEMQLDQAFQVAMHIQNIHAYCDTLTVLVPHLSESQLADAFAVGMNFVRRWTRFDVLSILVPYLSQEHLAQALTAARSLQDEWQRYSALASLAPHLAGEALINALTSARSIEGIATRLKALAAIVPYLPEPFRRQEAAEVLNAVQEIPAHLESDGCDVLIALAPYLQDMQLLDEALTSAQAIQAKWTRSYAPVILAPYLSDTQLAEILASAESMPHKEGRLRLLARLVPYLNVEQRQKALTKALEVSRPIDDQQDRSLALGAIIPHLPQPQRECVVAEALKIAEAIPNDEWYRLMGLVDLVPLLAVGQLAKALDAAQALEDEDYRSRLLVVLSPRLPESLYRQAIAVADSIKDTCYRSRAVAALIPRAPDWNRQQALAEVSSLLQVIKDDPRCSEVLALLAPHLNETQLTEAIIIIRTIRNESDRSRALVTLVPHLSELQLIEALQGVTHHVDTLTALVHDLEGPRLQQMLTSAMDELRVMQSETDRLTALVALAPHLPEAFLTEALTIALALEDERNRFMSLTALIPYLSGAQRHNALTVALGAAHANTHANTLEEDRFYTDYWTPFETLASMAPYFSDSQLTEALAAFLTLPDERSCSEALIAFAPYFPESQLSKAFATAIALNDESRRSKALAALAPHITEEQIVEALPIVHALGNAEYRFESLVCLLPRRSELQRRQMLGEAWGTAHSMEDQERRLEALSVLTPHMIELNEVALLRSWVKMDPREVPRTRGDLLSDLRAVMPALEALTTPEDMAEIAQAIIDVGRWWP